MTEGIDRRQLLGTLAAVATLRWGVALGAEAVHPVQPLQAPVRVRSGAPIDLHHPAADAFRLEFPSLPAVEQKAVGGRLRFRAPEGGEGFTALRCTPLSKGQPVAAAIEVAVLSGAVLFGA